MAIVQKIKTLRCLEEFIANDLIKQAQKINQKIQRLPNIHMDYDQEKIKENKDLIGDIEKDIEELKEEINKEINLASDDFGFFMTKDEAENLCVIL